MKVLFFAAFMLIGHALGQSNASEWLEINTDGIRLFHGGNYAAAESKFRRALVESEKFGDGDYRYKANLSNLALTMQEQGDFASAEKLYRRVLELRERDLPPDAIEIASSLNNLGGTLHWAGRDAEADPLLRRGLLIAENAHDDRVTAATLNTLALALVGQGQAARAEPVLRRAVAIFEKIDGPDSLDVGKSLNNLAAAYCDQKEFVKAEQEERRALPIYEKNLPANHPLVASVLNNLYTMLGAQKRFDEGESYLRRGLEIGERAAPDGLLTQRIRGNLATLEAAHGNWQAAATLLEQVIGAEERILGPNHPTVATTLANYSEALKHLNHKSEAKQAERRANAIMKALRP